MSSQHRKHRGYKTQAIIASIFHQLGYPHAQSAGAGRSGVDITGVPGLAIETKAQTRIQLGPWWRQTLTNAGNMLPTLIIRLNGQGETTAMDWPTVIRLGDFLDLWITAERCTCNHQGQP